MRSIWQVRAMTKIARCSLAMRASYVTVRGGSSARKFGLLAANGIDEDLRARARARDGDGGCWARGWKRGSARMREREREMFACMHRNNHVPPVACIYLTSKHHRLSPNVTSANLPARAVLLPSFPLSKRITE